MMVFCVDFDGTCVVPPVNPGDLAEELKLLPGALEALRTLKRAGHVLILSSARSNMAQRLDWRLNPLWASHSVPFDEMAWAQSREWWEEAHQQMTRFVHLHMAGVFDAIDNGTQGKPIADVYLDDRSIRMGTARSWREVAIMFGQAEGRASRGEG